MQDDSSTFDNKTMKKSPMQQYRLTKNVNRELTDIEKMQKEILWSLFQEYKIHARHVETIRTSVANYMLLAASVLITIIIFDKQINLIDLPLSILVTLIGSGGALFSFLYFNQYAKNITRAKRILNEIDELFFINQSLNTLEELKKSADQYRREEFEKESFLGIALLLSRKTLRTTHLFWTLLPTAIFFLGLILTFLSVVSVSAPSSSGNNAIAVLY